MLTDELKPCPFCGKKPDLEDQDTLYPSGTAWRFDEGIQLRTYHGFRDRQDGDGICYTMHCPVQACGCGAEISGDSKEDAVSLWNARAIEAEVRAEAQEPIKLLDSVKAFIQDGINDATQCDDADADHDFALSLGQLLNPLYAAPQPPAPCPKCEGRANGVLVAMPSAELKALQATVSEQSAEIERLSRGLSVYTLAFEQECETTDVQAERIAELEKIAQAYEGQVAAHNKTLDEVARLSALIEKCEKALRSAAEWGAPMQDAPKSSRPEWFELVNAALAAIAAKKGGAK